MTDLREFVIRLDSLLTGKGDDARRNAAQQHYFFTDVPTFVERLMTGSYYLSDGGYSRLVGDDERGIVGLASVSRDQVKARWDDLEVQSLVSEVNSILTELLQ